MGKKHIQKLITAQSRGGRQASKPNFWGGLEQYAYSRARWACVPWVLVGTAMALLVIVSSLASGYVNSPTLGGDREEIIREAARRGDYELAQSLYEQRTVNNEQRVLGADSELEELVYPEKRLEREIAEWEEKLERYPGHRDILLMLAQLYEQGGKSEKAREYWDEARILDPNGSRVEETRQKLGERN